MPSVMLSILPGGLLTGMLFQHPGLILNSIIGFFLAPNATISSEDSDSDAGPVYGNKHLAGELQNEEIYLEM